MEWSQGQSSGGGSAIDNMPMPNRMPSPEDIRSIEQRALDELSDEDRELKGEPIKKLLSAAPLSAAESAAVAKYNDLVILYTAEWMGQDQSWDGDDKKDRDDKDDSDDDDGDQALVELAADIMELFMQDSATFLSVSALSA
eukprot:CAMPEP_0170456268 /NCGR_PEP_ID=MMETSP0123-20130129/3960_1 /TAXON_ID=182087 /ORGANISM="Favella ehrenbergii, Strain Fehren 1" /LENGTH=140 /DNA_ID=CAMNT_0010719691 /DNA_START=234 /DNA_END=653 /DNA_ORIENTATION=-